MSFEGLTDVVVDNYMGVLSSMSESGYKAKQVAAARARSRNTSRTSSGSTSPSGRKYKSPEFVYSEKYGKKVAVYLPYDPSGEVMIKSLDGTVLKTPAPGDIIRQPGADTETSKPKLPELGG